MADDLAEDWWVEETPVGDGQKDSSSEDVLQWNGQSTKNYEQNKVQNKRETKKSFGELLANKSQVVKRPRDDEGGEDEEDGSQKKKKKKKDRKRKKISEISEEELHKPGTVQDFYSAMAKVLLKQNLTKDGILELLPDPDSFFPGNSNCAPPSEYLHSALAPVWRSALKKSLYMKKNGSPCLLIITGSAIRAVELNRQIKDFLGDKSKVAKLFAKHMKVEEQKKFLTKTNCQVGIGTPGRITELIKQGSLHTEDLVCIALDWNWRDSKLKRLCDIPEIAAQLFSLLRHHLLGVVEGSGCKFALL